MSRTSVLAIAVLVLACSVFLAFRSPVAVSGDSSSPPQHAGLSAAETTIALAARPTPAAETRFEVKNNWGRTGGDPVALIVLGTMLLGLAAAVRRAV
jgi:hypothetical protein